MISYSYMKESKGLKRLSTLALRKRRDTLVRQLPRLQETLRGSIIERYLTCGKANCKCSRGERHGPVWYWSLTLGPGKTTGAKLHADQVEHLRGWVENYRRVKEHLERITEINRELLRREGSLK